MQLNRQFSAAERLGTSAAQQIAQMPPIGGQNKDGMPLFQRLSALRLRHIPADMDLARSKYRFPQSIEEPKSGTRVPHLSDMPGYVGCNTYIRLFLLGITITSTQMLK